MSSPERRGARSGYLDTFSKRPRIMLISTDTLQQALFFKECWQIGCKPVSAFSREQALQKVSRRRCAIVIGGSRKVLSIAEMIAKQPKNKVGMVVMFSGGMTEDETDLKVYRREPAFRYSQLIQLLLKRS